MLTRRNPNTQHNKSLDVRAKRATFLTSQKRSFLQQKLILHLTICQLN
jgi:hypothetical protein